MKPTALFDLRNSIAAKLANIQEASSDFDLNPNVVPPPADQLRQAAVLVGLSQTDHGVQVLLTKRSSRLRNHPGQIAFPGGKKDQTDKGLVDTALREAQEEVGLDQATVEVLGTLAPHQTVTGFSVTPVVGWIHKPFEPQPEINEVEEVFYTPWAHVTNPDLYVTQSRRWQGASRHYYCVPYGPYYIWGATARILRRLAEAFSD